MKYLGAILLIITACLACVHTLDSGFVSDDFILLDVARNMPVHNVFTGNWLGVRGDGGFYRPAVILFWKMDYFLHGTNPRGYHLTNMLLHVLITLLAAQLVMRLQGDGWVALIAGVLFSLHPVHTEAVAWISGRTDLVAALFYLLSINLFLAVQLDQTRGCFTSVIALISGILAMLSKEIAYTLPVMLVIADRIECQRRGEYRSRSHFYLPYFISLIGILVVRYFALGTVLGGYGAAKHLRIDGVIFSYMRLYMEWLLTPLCLSIQRETLLWRTLMLGIGLLSLPALMSQRLRWSMVWFWITILPVLTICRPQYLYLPSLGFVWLAAILIRNGRWPDRTIAGDTARGLVMGLIVMTYLSQTWAGNKEWRHTACVAEGAGKTVQALYPDPGDRRVVFINPPVNHRIPIGAFQNGLTQAVQLWYENRSVTAEKVYTPEQYRNEERESDIVFRFHKGRMYDETGRFNSVQHADQPVPGVDVPMELRGMDPQRSATIEPPIELRGIRIESQLSNAIWMEDGTPLVKIRIADPNGAFKEFTLRAGEHSSDWAIDRPDVAAQAMHHRAPVAYSYIAGETILDVFAGHTYNAEIRWNEVQTVSAIDLVPLLPELGPRMEVPVLEIRSIHGLE